MVNRRVLPVSRKIMVRWLISEANHIGLNVNNDDIVINWVWENFKINLLLEPFIIANYKLFSQALFD